MLEKARAVGWNCCQTSTLSKGRIGYEQPRGDSVDELLRRKFDAKDEGTTL